MPDRHTQLPFSAFRAALECQVAGITVGDLHDAARPGSYEPRLRHWRMGDPIVPFTTLFEIQVWLDRSADYRRAEWARRIAAAAPEMQDIERWVA